MKIRELLPLKVYPYTLVIHQCTNRLSVDWQTVQTPIRLHLRSSLIRVCTVVVVVVLLLFDVHGKYLRSCQDSQLT